MSGPWPDNYDQLTATAAEVLRATLILDGSAVHGPAVAVALGLSQPDVESAVRELRRAGWLRTNSAGGDELTGPARRWLDESVTSTPAEAATLAVRLSDFQSAGLDPAHGEDERAGWAGGHRGTILAAIRATARAGQFDIAMALTKAAWQVAGRVEDSGWWHALARAGEAAAIEGRDPAGLIEVLGLSAEVFAGATDRLMAEQQWIRALDLCHTLGDHERTSTVLSALAGLYRGWGLLDKAMDVLVELVAEHTRADRPALRAESLAALGSVMLSAGRPSAAETYLSQATALSGNLVAGELSPVARAEILELRGRALWLTGGHARARRSFDEALALLVDVDARAADRLRALVALQPGEDLPAG